MDVSISLFETNESRVCEKVELTYAARKNESRSERGILLSVQAICFLVRDGNSKTLTKSSTKFPPLPRRQEMAHSELDR